MNSAPQPTGPLAALRVFVSHASEDKPDFVKPLVDCLAEHVQVWYDEYSIPVGGSISQDIDKGLRECDFGVVVLSPAFAKKHWTHNELGTLYALEKRERKIILPIWHNVGFEDVRSHWAMLLDRRSISSTEGPRKVADQLLLQIGASARMREVVAPDPAEAAIQEMLREVDRSRAEARIFSTEDGARLVWASYEGVFRFVVTRLLALNTPESTLFHPGEFSIHGPSEQSLRFEVREFHPGDATRVTISIKRFRSNKTHVFQHLQLRPTWLSTEKVGWVFTTGADKQAFTEESLGTLIVVSFTSAIREAARA